MRDILCVNQGGEIVDPAAAFVSVLDHGFLFGDSIYEAIRTVAGRPFAVAEHLERLETSAARLELPLPVDRAAFTAAFDATAAAAIEGRDGVSDVLIRLIVTRGIGPMDLSYADCDAPRWWMIAKPLADRANDRSPAPARVAIVDVRRNARVALDPGIKSGNYLNNVIALKQAHAAGAEEGVMCNPDGFVAECTTSNIFWARNGTLYTPSLPNGLLAGITRAFVLADAARLGIPVLEGSYPAADLRAADEAFLTSTTRNVHPIGRLADRTLPTGPITEQLAAAYWERLAAAG